MKRYEMFYKLGDNGVELKTEPDGRKNRSLHLYEFETGFTVTVVEGDGGYNLVESQPLKEDAIDVMMDDLLVNGGAGFIGFVIEGEEC